MKQSFGPNKANMTCIYMHGQSSIYKECRLTGKYMYMCIDHCDFLHIDVCTC